MYEKLWSIVKKKTKTFFLANIYTYIRKYGACEPMYRGHVYYTFIINCSSSCSNITGRIKFDCGNPRGSMLSSSRRRRRPHKNMHVYICAYLSKDYFLTYAESEQQQQQQPRRERKDERFSHEQRKWTLISILEIPIYIGICAQHNKHNESSDWSWLFSRALQCVYGTYIYVLYVYIYRCVYKGPRERAEEKEGEEDEGEEEEEEELNVAYVRA